MHYLLIFLTCSLGIGLGAVVTLEPEHGHRWAANVWWKYANETAHSQGVVGCYVCTKWPTSSKVIMVDVHQATYSETLRAVGATTSHLKPNETKINTNCPNRHALQLGQGLAEPTSLLAHGPLKRLWFCFNHTEAGGVSVGTLKIKYCQGLPWNVTMQDATYQMMQENWNMTFPDGNGTRP